ncbi:MAG TPA: hypothetical protein VKH37_08555, partial [Ferruginibacter sp.]|nr:hypothetical protein [Ferruginibacter sp.]
MCIQLQTSTNHMSLIAKISLSTFLTAAATTALGYFIWYKPTHIVHSTHKNATTANTAGHIVHDDKYAATVQRLKQKALL